MGHIIKGSHLLVALDCTHFDITIEDKLRIIAASMEPSVTFETLKNLITNDEELPKDYIESLKTIGVKLASDLIKSVEVEDEDEELEEVVEDKTTTPSPITH